MGGGGLCSPPPVSPGRRDSSGIRLYYTATLRPFNAGIMELGLVYTPVMAIPPRETAFVLTGYCTDKCTLRVSGRAGAKGQGPVGGRMESMGVTRGGLQQHGSRSLSDTATAQLSCGRNRAEGGVRGRGDGRVAGPKAGHRVGDVLATPRYH